MQLRKNLSESLEEYAARFTPPLPPDRVRTTWRLQGLRFLGLVPMTMTFEQIAGMLGPDDSPFIAPGVKCPTKQVTNLGFE